MSDKEKVIKIGPLPDFSPWLGCTVESSGIICIGSVPDEITACGRSMKIMITLMSSTVNVNCPGCIAEFEYRGDHPEAKKQPFGVVTHKRGN